MSNATEQTVFVRNLIEAVREYRCLYDKKDTAYFNRREKEKAWHIIGQKLGKSEVACHRRWKLLREKFAKELKKRDRMLENGEHFQSDWSCFKNIMYIEEHIAPRRKTDKLPFVVTKNLTGKRMVYEHATSADTTTETTPYLSNGLDFLAQFSKAALQAKQLPDSKNFEKNNLSTDVNTKTQGSSDEEVKTATTDVGSLSSSSSESSCSPEPFSSPNAVSSLLRELNTSKETGLNFVRNLTNALKINHFDVFKDNQQQAIMGNQHQQFGPNVMEDHPVQKEIDQKPFLIPGGISGLKHTLDKDEVVRSTLLRVNGLSHPSNKAPHETLSTEVTSTGSSTTNDLKDEIFGKMVITMLSDITDEECKDDAKFGIMQVLINAKRACRNKQLNN